MPLITCDVMFTKKLQIFLHNFNGVEIRQDSTQHPAHLHEAPQHSDIYSEGE